MIKHFQTAVNKFIRIIFGLNARDSVKDVMQKHSIFSINQLEELEMVSFMDKYLHGDLPETFKNIPTIWTVATLVKQEVSLNFSLAFLESN